MISISAYRAAVINIAVTCAALGLLVQAVRAQNSSAPPEQRGYTFRVPSNLVFLPTRVQTTKGDTIYGITEDQFIVEDDGVRQNIRLEDSPDSEGLSLVLALQCGRSAVNEFGKLKGLGAMVEEIVGGAPHEIAVVVYGERPYLLSDFAPDVESTRGALSRLKACGDYHAAAIDAVEYSLNLLRHRQNAYRRAILLIGEERDHGSTSKLHEVIAELGETNTAIYTVAFSPVKSQFLQDLRYGPNGPAKPDSPVVPYSVTPPSPAPKTHRAEEETQDPNYTDQAPAVALPPLLLLAVNALRANTAAELASLSGGEYMSFVTQRGFEEALERVANHVHNYYVLSFQPMFSDKPALHSLRVRVTGHPDAMIQTRKSYWSGISP